MSGSTRKHAVTDYTVGWICALPCELTAALHMLDVEHNDALSYPGSDTNSYSRGRMMGHNVVLACLTGAGTNQAAVVATHMMNTFTNIKFGLMVGIAGGAPSDENDIRLGDIVVSLPTHVHGGVIQMDFGTKVEGSFQRSGTLNKPPPQLVKAVQTIKAQHNRHDPKYIGYLSLSDMRERSPRMVKSFVYQGAENDQLFEASYKHPDEKVKTCKKCDQNRLIDREERPDLYPAVYYGNISSANHVMRDSETRDRIAADEQILAFEMEAAGLMDDFPCLVIRGICDYADSHKNKRWQEYAALVAAAYGKELLSYISPAEAQEMKSIKPIQSIQSDNKHYLMPRHSNTLFTGRRKVLKRIHAAICGPTDINLPIQRRFIIYGMGGAGKSEVCIKFAEENREQFWGIFWIDAVDITSAHRSFANIAKECGKNGGRLDEVKQWLANCEFEWLLIIDNADDINFDYTEYFPPGNRGRILLTSRNRECSDHHTVGHEYFEKLDEEDAFELLSKAAGIKQSMTEERSKAVSNVLEVLGYHALALVQAGSFIKKQLCSIEEYPAQYKKQRETLLRFHPRQAGSTYGDVYATFEVSAQVLKDSSKQEDSDALQLLSILGFFNLQDVQEVMFERAWDFAKDLCNGYDYGYAERSKKSSLYDPPAQDIQMLTDWHVSRLPQFLGDISSDSIDITRFRRAKNTLASFSLIRVDENTNNISMHPLAHSWSKDRLHTPQQNESLCVAASTLALSTGQDFRLYDDFYRNLHIHIESCLNLESRKTLGTIDNFSSCQIFYRAAWVFYRMNRYAEVRNIVKQTCDALTFDFNAVSRETRSSHMDCQYLASICEIGLGNYRIAIQLLEALYKYTDHVALDYTTVIEHELGRAYFEVGEHGKAISMLESVVAVQAETRNEHDGDRLASQHLLAVVYLAVDRNEEAVELLERVVAVRNETLDERHPGRLSSQHELARAYLSVNQPKRAVELLEKVDAILEKLLSAQHSDRLASEHALAIAYLNINQPQKAVELLEKVVAIEAKILSERHPDRLMSQRQLAYAYLDLNVPQKAIDALKKVVPIQAEVLDARDENRWRSEYSLAKAYLEVGKPGEAVTSLERVIHIEEEKVYTASYNRIRCQNLLADAYMALEPPETEKAERLREIIAANEVLSPYESSNNDSEDSGYNGLMSDVKSVEQNFTDSQDSNAGSEDDMESNPMPEARLERQDYTHRVDSDADPEDGMDNGPMSKTGLDDQDYKSSEDSDSETELDSQRGETGVAANEVDQESVDLEVPQIFEEASHANGGKSEDQSQGRNNILETMIRQDTVIVSYRDEDTATRRRKRDALKGFFKGKR